MLWWASLLLALIGQCALDGATELAVAIPFHISQFEARLVPSMALWNLPHTSPCSTTDLPITLVFVYAGDPDVDTVGPLTLNQALDRLWGQQHAARRCFAGGKTLLTVLLAPEHDNYSDAPCLIFTGMLDGLRSMGFPHVFQMETDVQPIRAGWADELLAEARRNQQSAQGNRWWQLGSAAQCQPVQGRLDVRNDLHINGNSLWSLMDDALWDYLERTKRFLPAGQHSGVAGCGTGAWAEVGVDHAMYRFRVHPLNWEYARTVLHKFQYTQLILNKCEDRYEPVVIRQSHRHTYLVHSKSVFLAAADLVAREATVQSINQWPDSTMQRVLKKVILASEWSDVQVQDQQCLSPTSPPSVAAASCNQQCSTEMCTFSERFFSMQCDAAVRCHKICAFLACQAQQASLKASKLEVANEVTSYNEWNE